MADQEVASFDCGGGVVGCICCWGLVIDCICGGQNRYLTIKMKLFS